VREIIAKSHDLKYFDIAMEDKFKYKDIAKGKKKEEEKQTKKEK
jgi:hypothetical protein